MNMLYQIPKCISDWSLSFIFIHIVLKKGKVQIYKMKIPILQSSVKNDFGKVQNYMVLTGKPGVSISSNLVHRSS